MQLIAPEPSIRRQVEVNGRAYHLSEYIGQSPKRGRYVEGAESEGAENRLPQGFLVEQPAGAVTPPHFHEHDQFQVVIEGFARFGKHDAPPVSVHYASGHTPYGPIAAGPEGVVYYTLRRAWDPGAKYMPASRDKLRPPPRRSAMAEPIALEELPALREARLDVVLAEQPDGLAGWLLQAPPGAELVAPAPGGNGQYHVVLKGDAGPLPVRGSAFVEAGAPAAAYRAGAEGAALLVLQFPG
jgi:hypothetical protein